MRIRVGDATGSAVRWNEWAVSPAEVIVIFDDGTSDSVFLRDIEGVSRDELRRFLDDEERGRIG